MSSKETSKTNKVPTSHMKIQGEAERIVSKINLVCLGCSTSEILDKTRAAVLGIHLVVISILEEVIEGVTDIDLGRLVRYRSSKSTILIYC